MASKNAEMQQQKREGDGGRFYDQNRQKNERTDGWESANECPRGRQMKMNGDDPTERSQWTEEPSGEVTLGKVNGEGPLAEAISKKQKMDKEKL
ncbi:hypothetical protein niasHT_016761 [Heterodera trifolii]|uniref:Uncharacterized protein n=1 Tax=Heterodera trifolii TaxID=157864 RepID=A0ABD2LEQ1_9BILA